jgi:hypothetical protein
MKKYRCENGHEFNNPQTIGEEWSESEVCPFCQTDKFEENHATHIKGSELNDTQAPAREK